MSRPTLEIIEHSKKEAPILIVDPQGSIGEEFAKKISTYAFVVLVSKKSTLDGENVLTVAYRNTFPSLPVAPYSHFIVVVNSQKNIKMLPQFVKEAKKRGAALGIVVEKNAHLVKEVEKIAYTYKERTAILVVGDLFSGVAQLPTYLDELLSEAKAEGRVVVSSMGLSSMHPVLLEDFLDSALQILFGTALKTGIFLLYSKQSITLLALLHILQKVDPMLRIDFREGSRMDEEVRGPHVIPSTYEYESKLKVAFEHKTPGVAKIRSDSKSAPSLHVGRFIIATALIILLLPLCLSLLFGSLGGVFLLASYHKLEEGSVKSSASLASCSSTFFSVSRQFGLPVFQLFQDENGTFLPKSWLDDASSASSTISSIDEAVQKFQMVLQGKSTNPKTDVNVATDDIRNSIINFQKIKTKNAFLQLISSKEINSFMPALTGLVDTIPQIINPTGDRTYLVLFQNNMELRPGGGFIGSYGVLKLSRGKITDFQVHDVYDADGQLRGHVEPPFPIRRYIPSVHWYLRDSNFDIDFSKDAQNAAFFLKEEMGQTPDGVLAIDTTFVKDLVGDLGSVYVPDYRETVTSDNFYLLTQKHAEKNFFPGSTQKKDFLRSLSLALQQKLEQGSVPYKKIAQTMLQDISQKHILVAYSDQSVESVLSANGLSSAFSVGKPDGFSDFVGVNEANLGVNKANYFIKRKIQQAEVVDGQGSISAKLTLSYFNGSTQWPGGDYKTYIQIILPQNAKISDITIDGIKEKLFPAVTDYTIYEKTGFIPPSGLEVNEYEEGGQSIFGFLTIVPSGKFQTIQVGYLLEQKLDDSLSHYNLRVLKQPGTDPYPYEYSLMLPSNFHVVSRSSEFQGDSSSLKYSSNIATDKDFSASIARDQ